jgi:hypothetical protein
LFNVNLYSLKAFYSSHLEHSLQLAGVLESAGLLELGDHRSRFDDLQAQQVQLLSKSQLLNLT